MREGIKTSDAGFSLVELMVVIAIVATLLVIALPSFRDTLNRNRIATESNDLISALNLARNEAITRTVPVSICPSSNSTACLGGGTAADWGNGWIVFVDQGTAGTLDGTDSVLRVWPKITTSGDSVTPSLTTTNIQFSADGTTTLTSSLNFVFKPSLCHADQQRQITLSQYGRATITNQTCT